MHRIPNEKIKDENDHDCTDDVAKHFSGSQYGKGGRRRQWMNRPPQVIRLDRVVSGRNLSNRLREVSPLAWRLKLQEFLGTHNRRVLRSSDNARVDLRRSRQATSDVD